MREGVYVRDFKFSATQWRILKTLTDVMLPCQELPDNLSEGVVSRLENLLRQSAWITRVGFRFALYFIEYASGILFLEWGRFTRIELEVARRRFERLSHHRFELFVLLAKLLKSLIQIAIYSDARVEAYYGNKRRAWRKNRFEFREQLVQLSSATARPKTPSPLADPAKVSADAYLNWEDGEPS